MINPYKLKHMKFFSAFVLTFILMFYSCDNPKDTQLYDYKCGRPAEIPKCFKNGKPVKWDCLWNDYYKDGKVRVVLDDEGDLVALTRKITGDWTPPDNGSKVEIK